MDRRRLLVVRDSVRGSWGYLDALRLKIKAIWIRHMDVSIYCNLSSESHLLKCEQNQVIVVVQRILGQLSQSTSFHGR